MARRNLILWLWLVTLVVIGVLMLLQNYLLLSFDARQLWPLLLIGLGVLVLARGDLGLSWAGHNFGITRGSVEAGTLNANAGELNLYVRALQREGRLIAGQYTANSRPVLHAEDDRAVLNMQRGKTWLLSLADWDLGIAGDLPWKLLLSSYLGEIEADMRGLIIDYAHIASGFGDIRLAAPDSPAGPIHTRSSFGNIYLTVPDNMEASVRVDASALFGVHVQNSRWQETAPGQYTTAGYADAVEPLEIVTGGTFGDLYLL